jgi:WD40 repeat protein
VLCKNIFSRNITRVFSAEKELHPDCIVLQECGAIVGTVFSEDNRYLFVNMRPFESKEMWTPTLDLKKINSLPDAPLISQQMEIHMWDLKSYSVIRRFSGHYAFTSSDNPFIIYPAVCKNFVASGGEDGNVYVWHVHQGTLVKILKGHENVVNVVSFHPHNPYFIASASDDLTVRIWK